MFRLYGGSGLRVDTIMLNPFPGLCLTRHRILLPLHSQFEMDSQDRTAAAPSTAMVKYKILRQFDINLRRQQFAWQQYPNASMQFWKRQAYRGFV